MFELEIVSTVLVDTDVIKRYVEESGMTLDNAIDYYTDGLDDCEYFLIGSNEKNQIKEYILKEGANKK